MKVSDNKPTYAGVIHGGIMKPGDPSGFGKMLWKQSPQLGVLSWMSDGRKTLARGQKRNRRIEG